MTDLLDDLRVGLWNFCVADLEQSTRFYRDGLGFVEGQTMSATIEVGSEMARGWNLAEGGKVSSRFLSRPDIKLSLMQFEEPKPVGDRHRKPINQLGLRSLTFICSNPKAIAARLEELGGKIVHDDQRGRFDALLVTDPDGVLLQLEAIPDGVLEAAFKKQ